jgi:hypothetical protein
LLGGFSKISVFGGIFVVAFGVDTVVVGFWELETAFWVVDGTIVVLVVVAIVVEIVEAVVTGSVVVPALANVVISVVVTSFFAMSILTNLANSTSPNATGSKLTVSTTNDKIKLQHSITEVQHQTWRNF